MARHAIHWRLLLLVATNAESHRVIHGTLGHGHLGHIAVAGGAVYPSANMRGMIEFHMRGGFEAVHTLPGDVFSARLVRRQLFDFRFVRGYYLMASHTEIDARYPRIRSLIHSNVAVDALQTVREVHFVGIGDGLNGFRTNAEEFADGIHRRCMRWRENGGTRHRRGRRSNSVLSSQGVIYDQRREGDCADNGRNTNPSIKHTRSQCQDTLCNTKCYRELDILYIPHSSVNPTFPFCDSGKIVQASSVEGAAITFMVK
jgi:hypothetical protein